MLSSALLHYAYMPVLVRSLCSLKLKPLLNLNTCLYLLIQTFRILKEPFFLTLLYSSLFLPSIPKPLKDLLEPKSEILPPSFYRPNHRSAPQRLVDHLLEYYNLQDYQMFMMHDAGFFAKSEDEEIF